MATGVFFVRAVLAPGLSLGTAFVVEQKGFGLLQILEVPAAVAAVSGWLILDAYLWFEHWLQHRVGFLWRVHRVHHSDVEVDVSTSLRFHPFEAFYSALGQMLIVGVFGIPLAGVLAYDLCHALSVMIAHGNLRIPKPVDDILRSVLTTPDVHRIHHSASEEMQTNYGSVLLLWDRLFGTYKAQPERGHSEMELGLPGHRDPKALHLMALLLLPFRSDPEG